MLRVLFVLIFISLAIPQFSTPAYPDEYLSYQELMELGKASIAQGDHDKAVLYFKLAHLAKPSAPEPRYYVNLIKRIKEGRVAVVELPEFKAKKSVPRDETAPPVSPKPSQKTGPITPAASANAAPPKAKIYEANFKEKKEKGIILKEGSFKKGRPKETPAAVPDTLDLDAQLWTAQPKTALNIELNRAVILSGHNIERFLIISPGFIEVERVSRDQIKITAKNRGTTFLHVWDDTGRWTFQVQVVFVTQASASSAPVEAAQESAGPFKLAYTADWSSYYTGNNIPNLERQNLHYLQWTGIYGDTPYGQVDTSAVFDKFEESTEVTGYTAGLTNGRIGDFKDFNLRGFDASKRFSALSLPGKYFRGALLEAKAFDKNIGYSVFRGKDRATFGFLSPGVLEERDSFLEGARMTLFPEGDHQYSINYAHGYGEAREDFLKSRVYSVETKQKFNAMLLSSEVAYDEDRFGSLASAEFGDHLTSLRVNYRNLERDFTTITSIPSGRGEIGGQVVFDMNRENLQFNSNIDVYRDRFLFNPDNPDTPNYDWNSSVEVPMGPSASWRTSVGYLDTPGLISPRTNARANNVYSRSFRLTEDRTLSTFIGNTYQRSRYEFNPISDFDRHSLTAGFRFPVIRDLSYFANYEYTWLDEIESEEQVYPQVFNTGLNYSKALTDAWSGNIGFAYRDENNTESSHSFLAGEDSVGGNVGVSYHPVEDFEFFVDGRMRNVWAESPTTGAYNEADVRFGVRSSWDLPFSWSPAGVVKGVVFKDLNGNAQLDPDETGIPNVKIQVGDSTTTTDKYGIYNVKIRAKKVKVEADIGSVPEGYVFSSPLSETIEIVQGRTQTVNFGLTTRSGIYGVVYFDENKSGNLDSSDVYVSRVKLLLDGKETAVTDHEGSYTFSDIVPGRHTIRLDVNSLPMEYLPLIKLTSEVEVTEGTTYILNIPLRKKR